MADFLGIPEPRLVELRMPIDQWTAIAIGQATQPFTHDDSVHPTELIAAMIDSHALGFASAVVASGKDPDCPPDVAEQAIARIHFHLSKGAARG